MRVGVVVPVRGFSPYLAEALEALERESPHEVVVVDDASPEPVALPPVSGARLVRRPRRGGPGAARATGEALLESELVAFCDADDAWEPGSLALRVAALAAEPDAVVCFGRPLVVGPDGRETGERWRPPPARRLEGEAWRRSLYQANPICLSSALVRRDALARAGGPDGDLPQGEDWDLWLRLAGEPFAYEPAALVRYRRHPGGLTAAVADMAAGAREVHRRHAGLVAPAQAAGALRQDHLTLARGLVRRRDWAAAREALAAAGDLGVRERALGALTRVPVVRGLLGRRDPYRPG